MSVGLAIVIGIIGVGILLIAIGLQVFVAFKQTNNRRSLEVATGFAVTAIIFYIGGMALAWYFSGTDIAKFAGAHPGLVMLAAA